MLIIQPVITKQDIQPALAQSELLKHHVYQLSETIPKESENRNRLELSAEYIFNQLSRYTSNIYYQEYQVDEQKHQNIVIDIKGEMQCGTYIIGAHYDTYDDLPGADDNISGVAGLIELVRLFSKKNPRCDLQFVAFTLEEPPYFRSEYMGSYIHAKSLHDKKINVKAMISLEMIGYFNDEIGSQIYPFKGMEYLYSDKGDFITVVGNMSQIGITRFFKKSMRSASDIPVYSINAPVFLAGIDFSDHLNYWQFGYPAIMITDTAFNRNKNYHTKLDTADRLDYKRMAKVVDAVYYSINKHMNQ